MLDGYTADVLPDQCGLQVQGQSLSEADFGHELWVAAQSRKNLDAFPGDAAVGNATPGPRWKSTLADEADAVAPGNAIQVHIAAASMDRAASLESQLAGQPSLCKPSLLLAIWRAGISKHCL